MFLVEIRFTFRGCCTTFKYVHAILLFFRLFSRVFSAFWSFSPCFFRNTGHFLMFHVKHCSKIAFRQVNTKHSKGNKHDRSLPALFFSCRGVSLANRRQNHEKMRFFLKMSIFRQLLHGSTFLNAYTYSYLPMFHVKHSFFFLL